MRRPRSSPGSGGFSGRRWDLGVAVAALGVMAATAFGCSRESEENAARPEPVFQERKSLTVQTPQLALGLDCSATSNGSACESGYCGFFNNVLGARHFGTALCADDWECPLTWSCVRVVPTSPSSGVCSPPANWIAAPTTVRAPPVLGLLDSGVE